jgi:transmembrane sensor
LPRRAPERIEMPGEPESTDIDAQAARWVVRLDGHTPTATEQRLLEEWLDRDVRHVGAYARARAIYLQFDQLRTPADPALTQSTAPDGPKLTRRRMLLWATGGGLAAALSGVALLWPRSVQEYSTRIGEMRREPLPDGSTITLNTGTRLAVAYTERWREVKLLHGEVLVEATADPAARLFKLNALDTQITTAAAAFAVRVLNRDAVQIMVQNGQVQVMEPSIPARPITLPANTLASPQHATGADPSAPPLVTERIDPAEVDRRLAWQRGQLSFEDVPLEYALQEFARYGDVRVVIDDPAIGSLKVVGLYSAADPIGFARTVAVSLGLRLEVRGGIAHLKAA